MYTNYLCVTIPILVLNTFSGTAIYNTEFFERSGVDKLTFQFFIGTLNLLCVILNGVRDMTEFSELNKLHVLARNRWGNLKNDIYIQLLVPDKTDDAIQFDKIKILYNELIQTSPIIPDSIISTFIKTFKNHSFVELPDIVRETSERSQFELETLSQQR